MGKKRGKQSKKKVVKNVKQNNEVESQGSYWVESVLDWALHDDGRAMYYLKWEDYDHSENSWEYHFQVNDCDRLIDHFRQNTCNGRQPIKYSFEEFDKFVDYLEKISDESFNDCAILYVLSPKKIGFSELRTDKAIEGIKCAIKSQLFKLNDKRFKTSRSNAVRLDSRVLTAKVAKSLNIIDNFGSISEFFEFVDNRKNIVKDLKKWENIQNKEIKVGKEGLPITVVNDIDVEIPKLEKYITTYVIDSNIQPNLEKIETKNPVVSCDCVNCYDNRYECCTAIVGFPMVYNIKGSLSLKKYNTILFECNSNCNCDSNCANRSIQRGRQVPLQIFRTESKIRGWGVRSTKSIRKGTFISQYTGEVLSLIEAEKRPTTYLFDLSAHLDSSDVEYTYVVDASRFGNITRFVNHSCDPNCRILFAWIDNYDKSLPIIALFAIKNIPAYDELTYDYSMELIDLSLSESGIDSGSETDSLTSESRSYDSRMNGIEKDGKNDKIKGNELNTSERNRNVSFNKIQCECKASNCRGFLYS